MILATKDHGSWKNMIAYARCQPNDDDDDDDDVTDKKL